MKIELIALIILAAAMAVWSVDLVETALSGHVNEIESNLEGLANGI